LEAKKNKKGAPGGVSQLGLGTMKKTKKWGDPSETQDRVENKKIAEVPGSSDPPPVTEGAKRFGKIMGSTD